MNVAAILYAQALGSFILPPNASQEVPECMLRVRSVGKFGTIPVSVPTGGRQRVASADIASWVKESQERYGPASAILDASCPRIMAVLVYATDASSVDAERIAAHRKPDMPCNLPSEAKKRRIENYLSTRPPRGTARYVVLARGVTSAYQYTLNFNWDGFRRQWQSQAGVANCDISVGDGAPIPR